jgi:hypothetical protein
MSTLDAGTPVLFLPARIETRFIDLDSGSELWVRVFPDQISVNSFEPELTDQEVTDGGRYRDAGNSADAWKTLASLYGAQRAAWIALQTADKNNKPPHRDSSWTKAAMADALPDSWTVVLISGAQVTRYQGSAITSLPIGLNPNATSFPSGSPVDADLQWLVDFDVAVQKGMGLKIPLNTQQRNVGFDRILVYGLRTQDSSAAAKFSELIDALHYTGGFAFVPQGSRTRNNADQNSAYSRKDLDYATSFKVEQQGAIITSTSAYTDGYQFAKLLGIDVNKLSHIQYADLTGALNATDMLRALWPATLGYFLSQIMYNVFSSDQIELMRKYALGETPDCAPDLTSQQVCMANAMARGPLPAFRVGRTPYGVLPVTSLRLYQASSNQAGGQIEHGLVNMLNRLWPTWLASAVKAPHMHFAGNPDSDLAAVLGMDASSTTFRGREVLGDEFLWNYMAFLGLPFDVMNQWWAENLNTDRNALNSYGLNEWDPRILHMAISDHSFPITLPTVQSGPLSETALIAADADLADGTQGNYIQWLKQAPVADIQADKYQGPNSKTLLYKILRESLILEYGRIAAMAEIQARRLTAPQFREQELLAMPPKIEPLLRSQTGITQGTASLTVWELLSRCSIPDPSLNWAEYLVNFSGSDPAFAEINIMRASLDRLSKLPTAELDRLFTEILDSSSHRLDVWATAIATAMLKRSRNATSSLNLGCYSWVEDVRPGPERPTITGADLQQVRSLDSQRAKAPNKPAGLQAPLEPLPDNGGHIYASSPAQACTAAILRSGYMTHKGSPEENLLSMDLSSERVRNALFLMDGARQGQALNALLGYLFESGLKAIGLQRYTQGFRAKFPIVGTQPAPTDAPKESVAASNIVDGLALRNAWDSGTLAVGGDWGPNLPGPWQPDDQNAVISILKQLDDYTGALGDLSISETVFQTVRGNFNRAGGLMEAISKGNRPPDPDVITTPRGGIDFTHRVMILFGGAPQGNPAWTQGRNARRAVAEPWLDAWVGELLPDPSKINCQIQYQDNNGNVQTSSPINLSDLGIGPLDLLAMSDSTEKAQRAELDQRFIFKAAIPKDATAVQLINDADLRDVMYLAQLLQTLVSGCRPLTPQDMRVPENNPNATGPNTDFQNRATATIAALSSDLSALNGVSTPDDIRKNLFQCSFYGIIGAIPASAIGTGTDPNLENQRQSIAGILQKRLDSANASVQNSDFASVFKEVFGQHFMALPTFSLSSADQTSLLAAFNQSSSLVPTTDSAAPQRWLLQLAYVRPSISRMDAALTLARVYGNGSVQQPNLLLGQLPPVDQDNWLALEIDPTNPPPKGRVALACFTGGDPIKQENYAGLLVDEWPERIPSNLERAAVAFHYEEPRARAPQTLLLGVCPDGRATWDDDLITAILDETLELTKIRTVDLDSIQKVGGILPGLYFPFNLKEGTVSTRFDLKKEALGNAKPM